MQKNWLRQQLEQRERWGRFRPLVEALDTFLYQAKGETKGPPHIRDAVDVKRWMLIVVFALIPVLLVSIWNTGLQDWVYSSQDASLMQQYLESSQSWSSYWQFTTQEGREWTILQRGLGAVLPIILISYAVGGFVEALFAIVRKHEITEGFLVTGILYALILPPTIPYWMVAVGVAAGVILAKEVFGGSGMNIVNPALACRAFLFFTFPGKMTGDVWIGTHPTVIRESLLKMNQEAGFSGVDGYSQATWLSRFNISTEIQKQHTDAIASAQRQGQSPDETQKQITTAKKQGGLGLLPGLYPDAYAFTLLKEGEGRASNWNLFLGNKPGCIGETSALACLLGACILIITGVGSWRSMAGMTLGAWGMALFFEGMAIWIGPSAPAIFTLPAYKHLLLGGLAFGAVFMITDPVSSPGMPLARWIYGILAGVVTVVIRVVNPAYPEGVMLAILMANVFAPLIDYYVVRWDRKKHRRLGLHT